MLLKSVNYRAVGSNSFHPQTDKEEANMQDRRADFGNLKMFPELAWKV